jgi:hypothetical protein
VQVDPRPERCPRNGRPCARRGRGATSASREKGSRAERAVVRVLQDRTPSERPLRSAPAVWTCQAAADLRAADSCGSK